MGNERLEQAVGYACGFMHAPYAYGGNGAHVNALGLDCFGGFDCSGLVIEVLQASGILGRGDWTAQGLYEALRRTCRRLDVGGCDSASETARGIEGVARGFSEGIARGFSEGIARGCSEGIARGAVLFFGSGVSKITHVSLAVNGWQMLEAGGGDALCTSLGSSTGFVRLRPIAWRKDLVAALMPRW